ncbi:hypothetical protein BV898_11511 [Hypsibius exemplaris]|uniref:UPAR/Ly6 domain-containing protein n=1 Tax=Hypsibius exemplaris TaxID=2072580 RepID=A0A1W0WGD9_HYPEX|nr:hypothetical protein BV898_11511 [Hypsibius exemplaris]
MNSVVIMAVVVLSCMATASALKCYVCDKNNCDTPPINFIQDCPSVGFCFKIYARAGTGGVTQIQRGCGKVPGTTDLGDNQCRSNNIQGLEMTVCNCNAEACNSAVGVKISMGLAGISIFVAFFLL